MHNRLNILSFSSTIEFAEIKKVREKDKRYEKKIPYKVNIVKNNRIWYEKKIKNFLWKT